MQQIILKPATSPLQNQIIPAHHHPTSPLTLEANVKLSRRDIGIRIGSSSLLPILLTTHILDPFRLSEARAESDKNDSQRLSCGNPTPVKRAFLDISIDGEPVGRVIVGLYEDGVPAGTARFMGLVTGTAGISYRRKEFVKIMPNYVQHGGVRSYGVDAEMAKKTGGDLLGETLIGEWEKSNLKCSGTKNSAGSVSIVVRNPLKPPPKLKLVARKGKFEIDEEEVGTDPNGTEFVINYRDSPELDASSLVIGRVMEGMEVVERISQVKTIKDNTGSAYFRTAKLIGDKRAVVAEKGFNRPYSKVIVTNCGRID
ncbi:hypothetical protein GIB67_036241 [Kingdonia uniflora]|uniref:PPIase cyclophilin-type domain-containing protein n=1 Tax=Kingdonia uniflora TaxID=39325 RepID=A0A7J7NTE0_9MAGN|nr:hypothetical protein GIB67_036241 [Kingdonia uniflora]